jgi:HD-like signal output (HDOD) protein/DNA-binding NarL/FixJ family response regulator
VTTRARVLIVDDDGDFRDAVGDLLDDLGYTCREAADAPSAVQALATGRFQVALVDLRMPHQDGHRLLQELAERGVSVPVIAMSGSGTVDDLIALLREGAAEFLRKPFRSEELDAALSRVLSRAHSFPLRATGPRTLPSALHGAAQPTRRAASRFHPPQAGRAANLATSMHVTPGPGTPGPQDQVQALTDLLDQGDFPLPAIAPIRQDLQQLMTQPTCSVDDIVTIVSKDPTVTLALLKAANSSAYHGSAPITTVRTACLRLGNKRVIALAQAAIIEGLFEVPPGPLRGVLVAMWKNIVVTAGTARALALDLDLANPDDVYVAAMLHNLGELVMLRLLITLQSDPHVQAVSLERTARVLRDRHEKVGRQLLLSWGVSRETADLAGAHHRAPSVPQSRASVLTRLVILLAWMAACRAGYTYLPAQGDIDIEPTLQQLGLKATDLDPIVADAEQWLSSAEADDA